MNEFNAALDEPYKELPGTNAVLPPMDAVKTTEALLLSSFFLNSILERYTWEKKLVPKTVLIFSSLINLTGTIAAVTPALLDKPSNSGSFETKSFTPASVDKSAMML